MIERNENLIEIECDALCVTTNGFIKANGECVMGAGIAKTIKEIFPWVPKQLGTLIKRNGNKTQVIIEASRVTNNITLVALPSKPVSGYSDGTNTVWPYTIGAFVPGFHMKSDINLIIRSIHELIDLTDEKGWETVAMPRIGCGNGGLDWNEIKPIIEPMLDDRFIVCHV